MMNNREWLRNESRKEFMKSHGFVELDQSIIDEMDELTDGIDNYLDDEDRVSVLENKVKNIESILDDLQKSREEEIKAKAVLDEMKKYPQNTLGHGLVKQYDAIQKAQVVNNLKRFRVYSYRSSYLNKPEHDFFKNGCEDIIYANDQQEAVKLFTNKYYSLGMFSDTIIKCEEIV